MNINNNASAAAVTTSVWNATTRRITGFNSAVVGLGSLNTALANGSNTGFSPPANDVLFVNVIGSPTANVTWQLFIGNGVTNVLVVAGASGAAVFQTGMVCSTGQFWIIANAGTVSGNFSSSQIELLF